MERTYLALIHKDPGSSFGVTFPDFLGCTSGGDTFEEAREMAREALALCLEGMAADGKRIPPPALLMRLWLLKTPIMPSR